MLQRLDCRLCRPEQSPAYTFPANRNWWFDGMVLASESNLISPRSELYSDDDLDPNHCIGAHDSGADLNFNSHGK